MPGFTLLIMEPGSPGFRFGSVAAWAGALAAAAGALGATAAAAGAEATGAFGFFGSFPEPFFGSAGLAFFGSAGFGSFTFSFFDSLLESSPPEPDWVLIIATRVRTGLTLVGASGVAACLAAQLAAFPTAFLRSTLSS